MLFKKEMKRVNIFVDMDAKLVKGSETLESEVDKVVPELAAGSSKRDDLVMLWSLVKEKFNSTEPIDDKEREIWVELKRLFEPDTDDELWKLQNHIHDVTWKLYDSCGVHHVSTKKGIYIYMPVEKEYPLSRGTLTLMLVVKLLVDQDNEMSRELLRKIFMQVNHKFRGRLLGIKGFLTVTTAVGINNTLTYEAKTGAYSFELDETRFVLDANLLREALEITPIDQAHQFVSPPSGDAIMDFVNELGYTEVIHFVSIRLSGSI
ncbi:hypothetical protein Tco_0026019 [Tanacetum coccineum]